MIFIGILVFSSILRVECAINKSEWPKFTNLTDKFLYPHRRVISSIIEKAAGQQDALLPDQCRDHLLLFARRLLRDDAASRRMLDSFTRKRAGQHGSWLFDLGNVDQCTGTFFAGGPARLLYLRMDVEQPVMSRTGSQSPNQSTLVKQFISSTRYLKMLYAVCLPSSCSVDAIDSLVKSNMFQKLTKPLKITVEKSTKLEDDLYSLVKQLCKIVLLVICLVNIVATVLLSGRDHLLTCFNMKRNLRYVFAGREDLSSRYISKLKVLIMFTSSVSQLFMPVVYLSLYPLHFPMSRALNTTPWLRRWVFAKSSPLITAVVMVSSVQLAYPSMLAQNLTSLLLAMPVVLTLICMIIVAPDLFGTSPLVSLWASNASVICYKNGLKDLFLMSGGTDAMETCIHQVYFVSIPFKLTVSALVMMIVLCVKRSPSRLLLLTGIAVTYEVIMAHITTQERDGNADHLNKHPVEHVKEVTSAFLYIIPHLLGAIIGHKVIRKQTWTRAKALMATCAVSLAYAACFMSPHISSFLSSLGLLHSLVTPLAMWVLFLTIWSFQNTKDESVTLSDSLCTSLSKLYHPYILVQPLVTTYLSFTLYQPFSFSAQLVALLPTQVIISLAASLLLHISIVAPMQYLLRGNLVRGK